MDLPESKPVDQITLLLSQLVAKDLAGLEITPGERPRLLEAVTPRSRYAILDEGYDKKNLQSFAELDVAFRSTVQGDSELIGLLDSLNAQFDFVTATDPGGAGATTVATAVAFTHTRGHGYVQLYRDIYESNGFETYEAILRKQREDARIYTVIRDHEFAYLFFVGGKGYRTPPEKPMDFIFEEGQDWDSSELAERMMTHRQAYQSAYTWSHVSASAITRMFKAAEDEYKRRKGKKAQKYEVFALKGTLRIKPTEYTQMRLGHLLHNVVHWDKTRMVSFATRPARWTKFLQVAQESGISIDPTLIPFVEKLQADTEKILTPNHAIPEHQRLGWLEGRELIRCKKSDEEWGYEEGQEYAIRVRIEPIETYDRGRIVTTRSGEKVEKDFVQIRKRMDILIGRKWFSEANAVHVRYIVEHFEMPDPMTVQTKYPDEYLAARALLTEIEKDRPFEYKEFQKHQLACLLAKTTPDDGGGLIGWEQGLGKTLAAFSIFTALNKMALVDTGLIIAPGDLVPQYVREAEKFGFKIERLGVYKGKKTKTLDVAKTRRQLLQVAEHLENGGTGLYVCHYELLTRVGVVSETHKEYRRPNNKLVLKNLPLDQRTRLVVDRTPAWKEWVDDAGDGNPGNIIHPEEVEFRPITAELECANCGEPSWRSYKVKRVGDKRPFCKACGHLHTQLKVKPMVEHLRKAFRHGVILIDEATLIKGESERSRVIRGFQSRYKFAMTGTPIKNYLPDAFWVLWMCAGNDSARFPYAYKGGKTQFENDFCVIEYETDGWKRKTRSTVAEITNTQMFWKLISPTLVRMRKEETGEDIVEKTFHPITVPMGEKQKAQTMNWIYHFDEWYAAAKPNDPLVISGRHVGKGARLGQTAKLDYVSALPEADPHRDYFKVEVSNWTPKAGKVLELAMQHVKKGDKVLIGSNLRAPGQWFTKQLVERQVKAVNVLKESDDDAVIETKAPEARAEVLHEFQNGDAEVLVSSIKAISLGHNLDAANVVIVFGLEWDYAAFDQFIARVHRLTSKKPVRVYVVMSQYSIDARKWDLLQKKGKNAALALDGRLIEADVDPIDEESVIKEMRDRGIPIDVDLVPESEVEHHWSRIKSIEDIPDLVELPEGYRLEDVADEVEAEIEALPEVEEPDPEPDDLSDDRYHEEEEEELGTCAICSRELVSFDPADPLFELDEREIEGWQKQSEHEPCCLHCWEFRDANDGLREDPLPNAPEARQEESLPLDAPEAPTTETETPEVVAEEETDEVHSESTPETQPEDKEPEPIVIGPVDSYPRTPVADEAPEVEVEVERSPVATAPKPKSDDFLFGF